MRKTSIIKTVLLVSVTALSLTLSTPSSALFGLGKITDMISSARKASKTISEEEEIDIGRKLAATLLGASPLVHDDEIQQYINKVGMWVALHSERPHLPWRFGILNTETINAFATPGGYVFISKGLFMAMSNEAQLAGVLGHEISHVIEKHHLNAIQKNARAEFFGQLYSASQSEKKKSKAADFLIDKSKALYGSGLDKKDEMDADLSGVVLAARAGYDPYALLNVLTTIDSISDKADAVGLFLSTHPKTSKRLVNLDQHMDGKMEAYATQPVKEKRFRQIHAKLGAKKVHRDLSRGLNSF
ncbi:MAG: M48 family metalloprotease [Gammaproteobacteria bacterium]|nr:M48 family metalloprotease [Gammaproteobacteria bacterium]